MNANLNLQAGFLRVELNLKSTSNIIYIKHVQIILITDLDSFIQKKNYIFMYL